MVDNVRAEPEPLHVVDDFLAKFATFQERGAFHLAVKIISDPLGINGLFQSGVNEVCGFLPTKVLQHQCPRKNQGSRVHLVLPGIFWCRAVCGLKNGVAGVIIDVGARGNTNAANDGRQRIGNVIAIQIERGND